MGEFLKEIGVTANETEGGDGEVENFLGFGMGEGFGSEELGWGVVDGGLD